MAKKLIKKHENLLIKALLLCLLIAVTYLNVMNGEFVSDDVTVIRNDPTIANFSTVISQPLIASRSLLLYISYQLGGYTPIYYHIFNVFFHLGTVLVAFGLLLMFVEPWTAFFMAALYAVHPILVEPVSWISAVPYPQSAFCLMLSLWTYALYKKNDRLRYYIISLIFALFSVLVAQKAAVIPAVILAYEFAFGSLKKNWKKVAPYWIVAIVILGLFFLTGRAQRADEIVKFKTLNDRSAIFHNPFKQVPIAITLFLQLMVWPHPLSFYHVEDLFISTFELIIRWIVLLGYGAAVIYAYKKDRFVFFWLLFFLIILAPNQIPYSLAYVIAERYAYAAALGIVAVFVYLVMKYVKNNTHKKIAYGVFILIIAAFMIRSIARTNDWQNEEALWSSATRDMPLSSAAHNNLGAIDMTKADYQSAKDEFNKALVLTPDSYGSASKGNVYYNIAICDTVMKNDELAIKEYRKAIELNPRLWQAYQNLGVLVYNHGRIDEAKNAFLKAIELGATDPSVFINLGKIYLKQNEKEVARKYFQAAVNLNPSSVDAQQGLDASK